jgi:hypothetical protein
MKTKLRLVQLFCCLTVATFSYAQAFERIYHADSVVNMCYTNNVNFGIDIQQSGDYYISLSQTSLNDTGTCMAAGNAGYTLMKLTATGDTVFSKLFIPGYFMQPHALFVTADSCIYVTGEEQDVLFGNTKIYIAKHSPVGDLVWRRTLNFHHIARGQALYVDSNAVYVGGITSQPSVYETPVVVKFDTAGQYAWHHIFSNCAFARVNAVLKMNNSFKIAGTMLHLPTSNNAYRLFTAEFDSAGVFLPELFYGDSASTYNYADAFINYSGRMILSAWEAPDSNLVLEIDSNDAVVNQFHVPGSTTGIRYMSNNIIQATDSNYVIAGVKQYYFNFSVLSESFYLQKINAAGAVLWEKEYSGSISECIALDSTHIMLTGSRADSASNMLGTSATLVIKTDSLGNSGVCVPMFSLGYYNSDITDSLSIAGIVVLINYSYGPGPFAWYINDTLYAPEFHSYVLPNDTGWMVIALIGCNDTITDSVYFYDPTAIHEYKSSGSIKVFPNPASDFISFECTANKNSENILSIYSIEGKLLLEKEFVNSVALSIGTWAPGMYSYIIRMADSPPQYGKFIKSN